MPGPGPRAKVHEKAKKGTFMRAVKLLFKNYPGQMIFVMVMIVVTTIGNLSSSLFLNFITTTLTQGVSNGENPFVVGQNITVMGINFHNVTITTLLIILGVIYLLGVFASWSYNVVMAVVTQNFMNKFRIKMFDKMQDLPIKYFDTHAHGSIMSLYTNDIDTLRQLISQTLPTIFQSGIMLVTLLVIMLMNSVWITLVVVFWVCLMIVATKVIGGKSSKYFVKQQKQVSIVEGDIEETMNGLKVIKVFTHEEESAAQFDELNEKLRQYSTSANIHGNINGPVNGNLGNLMYVSVAIVGLLLYATKAPNLSLTYFGQVEASTFVGMIVSFLTMARQFSNNTNNLAQQVTYIVMGIAGASRCFDLVDETPEVDGGYVELVHIKHDENGNIVETEERTRDYAWKHPHGDGTLTYTELKGDIVLDSVDFGYDPEVEVLHDISIYAHPGQKIALVGATGAGKTTITNLLNRFYTIQDGKIRYDGININKIKLNDLRRSLGIVLQDTNLFTGTIMENIRYGRLDATDEEVIEASKIANAYDFITRMPEGFNTMITGNGANLSQGQRQLLSIARCAVADAPVMILDEATSSIDTRTEKLVQDGMDKLMEGRTVFVIAHRLSTVQNSDAIMVMDHGRIIERGTHQDLIAQKGVYYQLYTGAFELE